jgi:hypothetical protein
MALAQVRTPSHSRNKKQSAILEIAKLDIGKQIGAFNQKHYGKKTETTASAGNGDGKSAGTATAERPDAGNPDTWTEDLAIPKPKKVWHGIDGLGITVFGVLVPALMIVISCISMPKRLTLVLLNHPIETIIEMLLIMAIPLVNYLVWASFCKDKMRVSRWTPILLGVAIGTCVLIAGVSAAGLIIGYKQLAEIGTEFTTGFSWMAMLSLMTAGASLYLANRVRLARDFSSSRRQVVVYCMAATLLPVFAFIGAEARPFSVRLAERMASSANAAEAKQGLFWLRQLNPERELRMECSDPRAAGIPGLFIPVKTSSQHALYFALTGKPYSFRQENNADLSSMPDDYLSRNIVGERIDGLSLTRSTMTGNVHPDTLTATVNWTFVFKNETSQDQEARAEIGLPPGAVIDGMTAWNKGEPEDAKFVISGKVRSTSMDTVGHDSPAMATDLGRGRILVHCYPIPQDQESKLRIRFVVPLNPETEKTATIPMPRFIASNFDLKGEHLVRLHSTQSLTSGIKSLKVERAAGRETILTGRVSGEDLESTKLSVFAVREPVTQPFAVLDQIAVDMARERQRIAAEIARQKARYENSEEKTPQVLVMFDGTKGVQGQLEGVRQALNVSRRKGQKKIVVKAVEPLYVVENVQRIAAPAPKQLTVVIDGSATVKEYRDQLIEALEKIPSQIPVSIMIASQVDERLQQPMSRAEGLKALKSAEFVGGQDNLKAVVHGAELAGETKGGALLWIHGPQPLINQEIYIMSPFASTPSFYDLSLGSGETDTYQFFKNHSEIGPFIEVPNKGKNAADDLIAFCSKWQADSNSFAMKLSQTSSLPANVRFVTDEKAHELLTLHANDECKQLLAIRHNNRAAKIAVTYGFLSPVSSAMVDYSPPQVEPGDDWTETVNPGEAPTLQGATNGTIGPQAGDATDGAGVNTAGTVRVNNLANLEALLNIFANLGEIGFGIIGALFVLHGLLRGTVVTELMGQEIEFGPGKRIAIGATLIFIGLTVPGLINWFVASARDANLFS